tara:strand:- start:1462 stop:1764 length:303 start_codon:yes stop_codon:yes gene_type:complete
MPEMSITPRTQNLYPTHPKAQILSLDYRLIRQCFKEARPAASRIKLRARREKRLFTTFTRINTLSSFVPIYAREWPFRSSLPCNQELLGSELLSPFFIGF